MRIGRFLGVAAIAAAVTACGTSAAAPPTTTEGIRALFPSLPATTLERPSTTSTTSTTAPARQRPPYPLESWTIHLVDRTRPTVSHGRTVSDVRSLTTLVWAPAVGGRWPLIVFSHGFQVGPGPYAALLEAWAAHGYVIAAPEFPLTDQAIAGSQLDENDLNNQPADVRFVTDSLVAQDSPLVRMIDPSRVGVAGHSDGAETALAAGLAPSKPGEPVFRAVIAMSVQPVVSGSSMANPPLLITQGTADDINPPTLGQQTWAQARSPRYYLTLVGGGHLPPVEAGSQWLPGIEAVTEAFLDCYVAGNEPVAAISSAASGSSLMSLLAG